MILIANQLQNARGLQDIERLLDVMQINQRHLYKLVRFPLDITDLII